MTLVAQMLSFSLPIFQPRLGRHHRDHNARSRAASYSKRYAPTRKRIPVSGQFAVRAHPTNIVIVKLCSKNQNLFLQVSPNAVVNGTRNKDSRYSKWLPTMFQFCFNKLLLIFAWLGLYMLQSTTYNIVPAGQWRKLRF